MKRTEPYNRPFWQFCNDAQFNGYMICGGAPAIGFLVMDISAWPLSLAILGFWYFLILIINLFT